jgi:hypothetical protein
VFVVRRAPLLPEGPLVVATNADKTCLDGQGGPSAPMHSPLHALSDTRHRRNGTEMQQQKPHYADRYGGGCAVTPS